MPGRGRATRNRPWSPAAHRQGDRGLQGKARRHGRAGRPAPATGASPLELAKLAEHTEPDFIAETYLAGRGQPVPVAIAEELLKNGDGWASEVRQANARRGRRLLC
jgi:hypothetical protein